MAKAVKFKDENNNDIYPCPYYPVGSLYISVSSTNPSTYFGGTWQKLGTGMTLWGASSDEELGTTVSAGLPNITGNITYAQWNQPYGLYNFSVSGAMVKYQTHPSGRLTAEDNYWGSGSESSGWFGIDASQSNPIYGGSNTVQPPALKVYFWCRTA